MRLNGRRVEDARVNLRIAFPEWSEARRERVLLASFENVGRGLAEFAWQSHMTEDEARARVRTEGADVLDGVDTSRGVVVLTAHFGNWELMAVSMASHGYPLSIVHRPRTNAGVDRLIMGQREAVAGDLLPRGNAARAALRALRDGRFLAMPYDQNCTRQEAVFVPFFGRLATARIAPVRIAMRTGAPVIPAFLHREPDGFHHVCKVRPILELVRDEGDTEAAVRENAARMTRAIEDEIRSAPENWTWLHRRWRTQPPGEPRPAYA